MLFNSFEFLVFAPIALGVHALLRGRALRWWMVAASYVFYGWAVPWHCLLLLGSTLVDFNVARRLQMTESPRARRGWLLASLAGNLGLLCAFKYGAFLVTNLNLALGLAGLDLPVPEVALPVGISFYTFQTLSYTIDVYRRRVAATDSFSTFALYVAFFPQLVAGPIERAGHLLAQLGEKQRRTRDDVLAGVTRILWGLAKKVVVADHLAEWVNLVYGKHELVSGPTLLIATHAFAFQIYLDFSAYSDIAIGVARTMGIDLRENFRWPYLARNVSEFWRRWHISLSTWLRDYLYIPLGGSRRGTGRTLANVTIVMALGGLWHGANYTFVLWGLWHGLALVVFHAWTQARGGRERDAERPLAWRDVPAIVLTYHVVLVSWVLFRAETVTDAVGILSRMLTAWPHAEPLPRRVLGLIGIAAAAHLLRRRGVTERYSRYVSRPLLLGLLWGGLIVALALFHAPFGQRFIYFQF